MTWTTTFLSLSALMLSASVLFLSINPTIVDAIAYRIKWWKTQ